MKLQMTTRETKGYIVAIRLTTYQVLATLTMGNWKCRPVYGNPAIYWCASDKIYYINMRN